MLPAAVALALRLSDARVLAGGQARLIDDQSHYLAWRMEQARAAFPRLPPLFDERLAFPEGTAHLLPPGLAVLGGTIARIAGVSPDGDAVARVGTILGAVLGALGSVLAALLALRLAGPLWATLAGLFLALWPAHIELSRLGRIDPASPTALVAGLTALLYLLAATAGAARRRAWVAAACGAALGALLWLSPDGLSVVAVLGGGMLAHQLARGDGSARWLPALVFLVAAIVAAPLGLASPYRLYWSLHVPSPLQPLLLLLAAALSGWLGVASRIARAPVRQLLAAVGGCAIVIVALTAAHGASPLSLVSLEPRPALGDRPPHAIPIAHLEALLTYLVVALPLLVGAALRSPADSPGRVAVRLLSLWSGALLLLGSFRLRFLPTALVLAAPVAALGVADLARRARDRLQAQVRPSLLRWLSPVAFVGSLCLLWPTFDYFGDQRFAPTLESPALRQVGRWLRLHASQDAPGVLAPPAIGHALLRHGGVPVVGTNLVPFPAERACLDTIDAFTTEDPRRAERIVAARRIGRVVIDDLGSARYAHLLRHLGRPWRYDTVRVTHRWSLAARLPVDSGAGAQLFGDLLPSVDWLQLEWETPPVLGVTPVQVFRVVLGALLIGEARPGRLVRLELHLVSNRGRPFKYLDFRRADRRGRFVLRLPYPTARSTPAAVIDYFRLLAEARRTLARGDRWDRPVPTLDLPTSTPIGPAAVLTDDWATRVHVGPDDVRLGRAVLVIPTASSASTPLHDLPP